MPVVGRMAWGQPPAGCIQRFVGRRRKFDQSALFLPQRGRQGRAVRCGGRTRTTPDHLCDAPGVVGPGARYGPCLEKRRPSRVVIDACGVPHPEVDPDKVAEDQETPALRAVVSGCGARARAKQEVYDVLAPADLLPRPPD